MKPPEQMQVACGAQAAAWASAHPRPGTLVEYTCRVRFSSRFSLPESIGFAWPSGVQSHLPCPWRGLHGPFVPGWVRNIPFKGICNVAFGAPGVCAVAEHHFGATSAMALVPGVPHCLFLPAVCAAAVSASTSMANFSWLHRMTWPRAIVAAGEPGHV